MTDKLVHIDFKNKCRLNTPEAAQPTTDDTDIVELKNKVVTALAQYKNSGNDTNAKSN